MVNKDRALPEGGSTVRGGANPQYLTLANVNAILEQEREKLSRIPKQFSRDPPFPPELLGKPYPKGYEPPKFHLFDGRNGSVMEHVSRFIHTMGLYAGDKELCLREFAKSLVDRAYTWYTTLRPRSIKTWVHQKPSHNRSASPVPRERRMFTKRGDPRGGGSGRSPRKEVDNEV